MIKKTLNLRNASLKEKISYLENKLNEHKENFENVEKAKTFVEKEKEILQKKERKINIFFCKIFKWVKGFLHDFDKEKMHL